MTLTKALFKLSVIISAAGLLLALMLPSIQVGALASSSITLSDPRPTETTDLTFSTSSFTTSSVECITLQLATAVDGTGIAGTTTGATFSSSTSVTQVDWALDNGTNGLLELTNSTGEQPADGNFVFPGVVNGAEATYYGIFTTYTDDLCTPANEVDTVTVAYATKAGELVQLTIDPTLTFTCSPVTAGPLVEVNGVVVTADSTASGIDHGNSVTASQNGVSAHDINVATNATGGYTVSIRHTGQLTNGGSNIDNLAEINATPGLFTAAGVEGWGYTTEDDDLAGGTNNRFTTASNFAGFTTSNEPIIDNTAAFAGTETTRVGHQVGIANTTPAGTYQTTVIYTVASVY